MIVDVFHDAHQDARHDEYVVRLNRPVPDAAETTPRTEPPWARRGRRRLRRRLVVLAVLVVAFFAREPIIGFAQDLFDGVVEEVTAVEEGMGGAVRALDRVYEERGTYEASLTDLQTLGPQVDWTGEIEIRLCFGGQAVVVVSHGDTAFSRLLVQGDDWGQLVGERSCPKSLTDPHPWTAPSGTE